MFNQLSVLVFIFFQLVVPGKCSLAKLKSRYWFKIKRTHFQHLNLKYLVDMVLIVLVQESKLKCAT